MIIVFFISFSVYLQRQPSSGVPITSCSENALRRTVSIWKGPTILAKRSCPHWLVKFHWSCLVIAYRRWSNVITGVWPRLSYSVVFAITIMECCIMTGDLDYSLYIGNNTDKSAQIGDLSVWVAWKAAQETFCTFSVFSFLTYVSHSLSSSIPFAVVIFDGIFVVSVFFGALEGKLQVHQCKNLAISLTFYYLKI